MDNININDMCTIGRVATVSKQAELNTGFIIYKNGTVMLKNDEDKNITFTKKIQLDKDIFMYHADNDNVLLISSKDMNLIKANQLRKEDRDTDNAIFDSTNDDISDYSIAMYIFVNKELHMGHGKAASQVGHCVQKIVEFAYANEKKHNFRDMLTKFKFWKDNGHDAKIVCKVNSETFKELSSLPDSFTICDMGLTQIPAKSETVVGFFPDFKKNNPDIFHKQKLY
jgi:peptidyl-tRNA hydrolase